jgi:hypothetical protein
MTQAVRDVILGPMRALYPPPQHLREPKALELALAAYETALAGFDRETLQKGWDKVVADHNFWCWPNPGLIAEACRQCEPRPKPPSEEEQRRQKAQELAEAYASRYMKSSQVAKLARREGWAGNLLDYVQSAAWVQAQLVCQVRHLSWDSKLAEPLGRFRSSQEAFAAYRPTVEKALERGQVRVTVPQARIRQWKEQCRQQLIREAAERTPGG